MFFNTKAGCHPQCAETRLLRELWRCLADDESHGILADDGAMEGVASGKLT